MKKLVYVTAVTSLMLFIQSAYANNGSASHAGPKPRVLVITTSTTDLSLKEGKTFTDAGVYLDEIVVPLKALIEAGYEPVFANPRGAAIPVDPRSENVYFFEGSEQKLRDAQAFMQQIKSTYTPGTLKAVVEEGLSGYKAVFIPGGFGPMQDLASDTDLGIILKAFHAAGLPTGLICHGPIALLSTLTAAKQFENAMIAGDFTKAAELSRDWIYRGYRITVFSSAEELIAKPILGGDMRYYASDALSQAGAHVDRLAQGQVNVITDREVITGQQPFSSSAFAEVFVASLKAHERH